MKKTTLLFLALFVLMTANVSLKAQAPYTHSIGGILGYMNGVSYKAFVLDKFAIQTDVGISSFSNWWSFLNVSPNLMYEKEIKNIGLYWFVGGGVNLGIGSYYHKYSYYTANVGFGLGLNAIGGVEYQFNKIPLALQIDIRPGFGVHFNTSGIQGYGDWRTSISARYTF